MTVANAKMWIGGTNESEELDDMTREALIELFEKHNDDFLKFEKIVNPAHPRPDIAAFIMLDKLCPRPGFDMVTAAEHDEIWLEVDLDDLRKVITEDQVLDLVRCGIRYDSQGDGLAMFV